MGFPVEEAHRFAEEIGSREDTFNSVIQSIDIDKAGTSVAYDKEMIISELEKHHTKDDFNMKVRGRLRELLAFCALDDNHMNYKIAAKICTGVHAKQASGLTVVTEL